MERWITGFRYPHLDIELIVQRYIDRLETMIGLQYQGIFIKHYLRVIGVLRHPQADKTLMRYLKNPKVKTPEDLRAEMEAQLVGKFREASPEVRFQGYLNRENSILEKKGQAELIPAITTLKTIKFVKQQLEAAREAGQEAEPSEPDTEST